jgi:hypothetical protein
MPNDIKQRIDWWRNDVAYKAPEQVTTEYVVALLEDLALELEDPRDDDE